MSGLKARPATHIWSYANAFDHRFGAAALHAAIKTVTGQPVKVVINTGGQDHRWIGNGYWKKKGAKIIASEAAVEDQKDRGSLEMTALDAFIKKQIDGTDPVYAGETFAKEYKFTLGGVAFEIHHKGQAHTPGDAFVWLPQSKVMFSGDIVYVQRLAGVGPQSNAGSWIKVLEAMAAYKSGFLVPRHCHGTDLKRARAETYDYLVSLGKKMAAYIENSAGMIGSVKVDQSAFSGLENFSALARRNAQQLFAQMEFE